MSLSEAGDGFGKALKIEQIIASNGIFVSTTVGTSMYPMLRDRRDTVIVTPCQGRLKKYDVPLYRRGGEYVMHRIIKVLPDSYVIRGDNCMLNEYGITDDDIIGVLSGFYRGKKQIRMDGPGYMIYSRVCVALHPVRYAYHFVKNIIYRLLNKPEKIRRT